jgi:[ribosomal protein S18]-alanine N-acetyltransferase
MIMSGSSGRNHALSQRLPTKTTVHPAGSPPGSATTRVSIGPLTRPDVNRCAELEQRLFASDDPWRAEAFTAELDLGYHYLAARLDGVLVGYAGLALHGRPPYLEAEVHTIGVDPTLQHRGIGRGLLRGLLAHADAHGADTYLEVRTDNTVAIELYRSEGFEVLGIRRRYYQPSGADAYTMRRRAPHPAGRPAPHPAGRPAVGPARGPSAAEAPTGGTDP